MSRLLALTLLLVFCQSSQAALDPTKPLFGTQVASQTKVWSRLMLQSIFKTGSTRKVVINGKILSQGDSILEYKVTAIKAREVVLDSEEKHLVLSLFDRSKFSKRVHTKKTIANKAAALKIPSAQQGIKSK